MAKINANADYAAHVAIELSERVEIISRAPQFIRSIAPWYRCPIALGGSKLQCPKCGFAMSAVAAGRTTVHRCDSCHGIACQDDALSHLQRQWFLWPKSDPREIDLGAAGEGRRWNEKSDVPCPECGLQMQTVQATGQEHIRLDRCAPCDMTFFDAGEMTDLRFETLADSVRGLLIKIRGA